MLEGKWHSLWSNYPHPVALWCAMMIQTCLFLQTLQHEYEWKENSLFWPETCLLRRKIPPLPPTHSVWSGALIKQRKRNIFTFQICCISKAPLSVGYALYRAGRQRIAQGEMTQVTNGWLGICSAWKPIITGNMRVSGQCYSQLKRDLGFQCWNGLHTVSNILCVICWIIENAVCDPELRQTACQTISIQWKQREFMKGEGKSTV